MTQGWPSSCNLDMVPIAAGQYPTFFPPDDILVQSFFIYKTAKYFYTMFFKHV